MRILYGVVGEGMGHATRSSVLLAHLIATGKHEIEVVVSGRAHAYLQRTFPSLRVHEIAGLNMVYRDNKVKRARTAWDVLSRLPTFAENYELFSRLERTFQPELIISDFESFTHLYGKTHRIPVISVDNMQIINRCRLDVDVPRREKGHFRMAKAIVKSKLPGCYRYLITSFFFPEPRKRKTKLYPPILRRAILDAVPSTGDHVLVYQTTDTFTELIPTLQKLPGRFIVYGLKREAELGNVTLKGFSEQGFVDDLASARAVIAGGGFSLMGEAVQLGKPMLSVPLERQFEQTLNALYLEKLGFGEYHQTLSEAAIAQFLERAPSYATNLQSYEYRNDRNRRIFAALDAVVARAGRAQRRRALKAPKTRSATVQ